MKTYELINLGSKFLKNKKILSSRIDSEIILSHVMGIPRERLLVDEKVIKVDKIKKFKSLILRRSENEPVAYITKNKEFRSVNFFVDKNSLIPRPETELLIDPIVFTVNGISINCHSLFSKVTTVLLMPSIPNVITLLPWRIESS